MDTRLVSASGIIVESCAQKSKRQKSVCHWAVEAVMSKVAPKGTPFKPVAGGTKVPQATFPITPLME